jgi:adenine-specific DNA-methyltransferase
VVVAEFRDPIYPGLVSTGKVERGGDKPFHTVINAENYHALQALLYTHEGKVDAIYIDPPYNTGARDWKYNNDYVDSDDAYRHSKWLAMMERRLKLAKRLLNPEDSVLIVTIDESTSRATELSDEYVYCVMMGAAIPGPRDPASGKETEARWQYLRRDELTSARSAGRPQQFYPVYVSEKSHRIVSIGDPLPAGASRLSAPTVPGCSTVFPVKADGTEMVWGLTAPTLKRIASQGFVRVTLGGKNPHQPFTITYLRGAEKNVASGRYQIAGERDDGSKIVVIPGGKIGRPTTVWREPSHDAGAYGTSLLGTLLPERRFPFPKSLYAVEDTLRVFIGNKPDAVLLDFFAGSGTTAHAVMRLNAGRRSTPSISVTNNEVSADEDTRLRAKGLRPGDPEWEALGICEHITKPRIAPRSPGRLRTAIRSRATTSSPTSSRWPRASRRTSSSSP